MISLGAKGVISVASNLIPGRVKEMVAAALAGDFAKAAELHDALYPFFRGVFIETNPIPIKAAMAERGMLREEYRLPLCPMSPDARKKLLEIMDGAGI